MFLNEIVILLLVSYLAVSKKFQIDKYSLCLYRFSTFKILGTALIIFKFAATSVYRILLLKLSAFLGPVEPRKNSHKGSNTYIYIRM